MPENNPLLNWEGPVGPASPQPETAGGDNPLLNWSGETKRGEGAPEAPGKLESFARGVGQGATLGWGDRLLGALTTSGMLGGGSEGAMPPEAISTYEEARAAGQKATDENRAANERAQKANPWTYAGGNIAGSLPVMIAAPGGVAGNAAIGAVQGASEGDTLGERARNAGIGGVLAGALGGAGHYLGKNAFGSGAVDPLVGQAREMGVDIPRYLATEGQVMPSAAQTLKNVPVAGVPIERSAATMRDQMGNVLAEASGGVNAEQAGQAATDSLKHWITTGSHDLANQMYTRASSAMSPTATSPLNATAATAANIAGRRGNAAIVGDSGALAEVSDALARPGGLTYEGLKDLRSSIRYKMENSLLPGNIDKSELKQLYGALSRDLDSAAYTAGGQKGLDLHNQANQAYQYIAKDRKDLTSLLGGPAANAAPEKVFANIVQAASVKGASANAGLLEKAKNIMPASDWDNLAAGTLGHMGLDAAGSFSPQRFLGPNGYNKLSDKAKDLLFGQAGSPARDQLETLARIAGRYGNYTKFANPSGTGHAIIGAETAKSFFTDTIHTALSILGGRQAANYMSQPAGVRTATSAALGTAGKVAAPLARTAATRGPALMAEPIGNAVINPIAQRLNQPPADNAPRAAGGRTGRATGGRANAMSAEMLIAAAERAKKQINATTQPLLRQPDEHIVRALDIASQSLERAQ